MLHTTQAFVILRLNQSTSNRSTHKLARSVLCVIYGRHTLGKSLTLSVGYDRNVPRLLLETYFEYHFGLCVGRSFDPPIFVCNTPNGNYFIQKVCNLFVFVISVKLE